MKKILLIFLIFIFIFSIIGCVDNNQGEEPEEIQIEEPLLYPPEETTEMEKTEEKAIEIDISESINYPD